MVIPAFRSLLDTLAVDDEAFLLWDIEYSFFSNDGA